MCKAPIVVPLSPHHKISDGLLQVEYEWNENFSLRDEKSMPQLASRSKPKQNPLQKLKVDKLIARITLRKDLRDFPEWTEKHLARVHTCFRKEFAIMARKLEVLYMPGLGVKDSLGLLTGFFKWLRPLAIAVRQHQEFEETFLIPILRNRLSKSGTESDSLQSLSTESDQERVSMELDNTLRIENTLDEENVTQAAKDAQCRGAEFLEVVLEAMDREVKYEYVMFEQVASTKDLKQIESEFKSFWKRQVGMPKTAAHLYVDRGDAKKEVVKEQAEKVKGGVEKVKDGVVKVGEEVVEHTKEGAEKVKGGVDKVKVGVVKVGEEVVEHTKEGAEKVKGGVDKVKERTKEHKEKVKEQKKEKRAEKRQKDDK
eukprot:CAMPEP_0185851162 /NCGR_PEP_ID=MMETSP1354-20130828/6748_1 /TAXON_ID=708628 /ORGANISM="Erythrolobus madagascarensis, Strain CCMP3276" /LENGTH=369 /DNA_ID=CAMNT_0028552057 /DNA_START=34 /DNA_END=1143 /DNA_ORIENTATION=+